MKQLFQSDLTKTLLYFTLTLIAAAAIAPWPYNLGKMISEVGEVRATSAEAQGITGWFDRAEFAHFFLISLLGCALLLAGPFICWMRFGSTADSSPVRPWSLRLPQHALNDTGQPLARNPRRVFDWTTGFLLAGSLLALMNWLFLLTGWFAFNHPVDWLPALMRALICAIVLAVMIEWVFRGVFLGVLLRSLRPSLAIVLASVIFAGIHFLFPPEHFQLKDAGEADAGFRFIGAVTNHLFAHPGYCFGFASLLFAGLILTYTRYRTASLSLAIGLQSGWMFVFFLSHEIITFTNTQLSKIEFIIGPDRRSGLIPLCILIATGLLVHVFLQISTRNDKPT